MADRLERVRGALEHIPTAERRAVLEVLLRENGRPAGATQTPTRRWILLLPCVLLVPFVSMANSSTQSESAPHLRAVSVPIGPRSLEWSACQNEKAVLPMPKPAHGADQVGSHLDSSAWHRQPRSAYPAHDAFDHPRDALKNVARFGTWNTSDFPLLLCVGQGKTATKSLNKAFVMLGMRTAHFYGAGVYGLLYDNAAERKAHSFMFNVNEPQHVDAVLDTPVVDFYNEVLLSYPNAWVILTVRKTRSWLKSQQKFYGYYAKGCRRWLPPWQRGSNLVYGTECPSREQALKRYVQHNRNVYDSVEPSRLLIMDMLSGDGWDKLCPFLKRAGRLGLSADCPPTNLTLCQKAGVSSCAFPNRK